MDIKTTKEILKKSELLKTDKNLLKDLEGESQKRKNDAKEFLKKVDIVFDASLPENVKELILNTLEEDNANFLSYYKYMCITSCHGDKEAFKDMANMMQLLIDKIKTVGEQTIEITKLKLKQEH